MDKIKKKKGFVCLLLLLSIIFANAFPDRIVRAESVDHTHVWATSYDENHHWEYCTVCGETRNEEEHSFTDHWNNGKESCRDSNFSTRICECGYSYIYHKPHSSSTNFSSHTRWEVTHWYTCVDCDQLIKEEQCYNDNGPLNCMNPGKCSVCGGWYTSGRHSIDGSEGKCIYCGKKFYTVTDNNYTYSSDFSKVIWSFNVDPVDSSVVVSDTDLWIQDGKGISKESGEITKNLNGTYTVKIVLKITDATRKITVKWHFNNVKVNGVACFTMSGAKISVYKDHFAPVVTDVNQTNQTEKDGWATIKKLDISGTEENSSYVHLSIEDSLTGEVLIEDATASVVDGKWSYSCTPPIEANEDGHDFMVKVYDDNNNTSTKDFTVYKADCIAPTLDCPTSYTDWTDTAKDITLTIKDGGVGSPQVSLGNQISYKPCTNVNGKWQITYTFSEDIDGTEDYDLYLKDALGNARKVTITVGNIDKNKYTITYNLNGGSISGQKTTYTRTTETFKLPTPTKTGYTFTGWTGSNGTTAQKSVNIKKGSYGNLSYTANWSYDPIKVSMPQTLIGDKNGNSQFMVKSDDIKAGSIEVTFPKGFYYNQAGKNPVFASLLSDGSTTITKDNKVVKCKIMTNDLTAGCWSGVFNINLKLNK